MSSLDRATRFMIFLKKRKAHKCPHCDITYSLDHYLHDKLCFKVDSKYSIDDDYFYIKGINDILFNNQVIDHFSKETNKIKKKEGQVVNPHSIISKDSNIYNG